jgi:hypothetical protein
MLALFAFVSFAFSAPLTQTPLKTLEFTLTRSSPSTEVEILVDAEINSRSRPMFDANNQMKVEVSQNQINNVTVVISADISLDFQSIRYNNKLPCRISSPMVVEVDETRRLTLSMEDGNGLVNTRSTCQKM